MGVLVWGMMNVHDCFGLGNDECARLGRLLNIDVDESSLINKFKSFSILLLLC